MVQPNAEPKDWEEVLKYLHFPASLSEIMKSARDVGGVDHEVHDVIARLSQDSYETQAQFVDAVRQIYLADGIAADKLPL
jgi:hypothetical protein